MNQYKKYTKDCLMDEKTEHKIAYPFYFSKKLLHSHTCYSIICIGKISINEPNRNKKL